MKYLIFKKEFILGLFLTSISLVSMEKEEITGFELNAAARTNNIEKVRELLRQGSQAVINEVDNTFGATIENQSFTDLTPLMWAAYNGNKKMVELLLAAGADATLKSTEGLTAAQIAIAKGYPNIAEFIKEKSTVPSLYMLSRRKIMETPGGKEALQEIKKELPEHYPFEKLPAETKEKIIFNLTKAKTLGQTIENVRNFILSHPDLIDFAYNTEFTERLIKFILQEANRTYTTAQAINVATLLGTVGAVNWLKEQFKDKAKRKEGERLLKKYITLIPHITKEQENKENFARIRILLKAGINPDNGETITPLMWAASVPNAELAPLVQLLLEHGVDPCTLDPYGASALDYAKGNLKATASIKERENLNIIIKLLESAMQKCKAKEEKE